MAKKNNNKQPVGNFSPAPDANNPLFNQKKDRTADDDIVDQINQMLPGVLPQQQSPGIEVSADVQVSDSDGKSKEPLSDMEVLAILDVRENRARDFVQNEITLRAAESMEDYYAQPEGKYAPPESIGRSNFVDRSVADAINWMLPQLIDVFCGTEEVVNFTPRNKAQEKSAEMTTAMVNHVWNVQNEGYAVARTWIHDALWAPAGIIKVFWKPDSTVKTRSYTGLTDLQYGVIALAAEAGECAIIRHRIYDNPNFSALNVLQHGLSLAGANITGQQSAPIAPQLQQAVQQGVNPVQAAQNVQIDPGNPEISEQLHDIDVVYNVDPEQKRGIIKVENIPLEEFYLDPQARNIREAKYAAHARRMTLSDLRAEGFDADVLDDLSSASFDPTMSNTYLARTELQGAYAYSDFQDGVDPSQREVIVVEAYIQMDYKQTGIAEWRKIIRVGNTILLNEPTDGNPFFFLVSNPLPHTAFGISVAEQAHSYQRNSTALMRSLIDNVQFGANAQMYAVDGDVNMDDLLDSRPGAIVRVKSPEAVGVLQTSSGDVASVATLLETLDTMKQESTGVQKLTQGSDADIINETATGYQAMTERSEQRIKLVARQFAETGFKPLAKFIQKLLAEHQDEYMQIRVNGQLIDADPNDANNEFDVDVKVGLGTGDKTRTVALLNNVLQLQQQAMAQHTGMVTLNHVFNTVEKLVKAMGFPNAGEFFQQPPSPLPQVPPPQMSPDVQAKLQMQQQEAQADAQRQERQAQLDAMRIQAQATNDNKQAEMAHQREMARLQMQQEIEREKMYLQAAIQREQAALQAMIDPQTEGEMFNETFASTSKTLTDALTNINLQASGDYDRFLQAAIAAPEPTAPDQVSAQPQNPQAPQMPQ